MKPKAEAWFCVHLGIICIVLGLCIRVTGGQSLHYDSFFLVWNGALLSGVAFLIWGIIHYLANDEKDDLEKVMSDLREEVSTLRASLETYENQGGDYSGENERLREKIIKYEGDIRLLKDDLTELEVCRAKVEELKAENEGLYQEKSRLEDSVCLHINQVERLQQQLRDAGQNITHQDDSDNRHTQQQSDLPSDKPEVGVDLNQNQMPYDVKELQNKFHTLETEKDGMNSSNDQMVKDLQRDLEETKKQLDTMRKSPKEDIGSNTDKDVDVQQYEERIEELQNKIRTLETERDGIGSSDGQMIKNLQREVELTKEQLDIARKRQAEETKFNIDKDEDLKFHEEQIQELQHKIHSLENERDGMDSPSGQRIMDLQRELEQAREQLNVKKEELEEKDLEVTKESEEFVTSPNQEAGKRKEKMAVSKAQLAITNQELQNKIQNMETEMGNKISSDCQKMREVEKELAQTTEQLDTSRKELRNKVQTLENEMGDMTSADHRKINELERDLAHTTELLDNSRQELQDTIRTLEAELEKISSSDKEEIKELERELANTTDQLDLARKELHDRSEELTDEIERLAALHNQETEKLRGEVAELTDESASLKQELQDKIQTLETKMGRIASEDGQKIEELEKELAHATEQLVTARKELQTRMQKWEAEREKLSSADSQRIKDLEKDLARRTEQLNNARKELQNKIQMLESEIGNTSTSDGQKIKELEKELTHTTEQLDLARKEHQEKMQILERKMDEKASADRQKIDTLEKELADKLKQLDITKKEVQAKTQVSERQLKKVSSSDDKKIKELEKELAQMTEQLGIARQELDANQSMKDEEEGDKEYSKEKVKQHQDHPDDIDTATDLEFYKEQVKDLQNKIKLLETERADETFLHGQDNEKEEHPNEQLGDKAKELGDEKKTVLRETKTQQSDNESNPAKPCDVQEQTEEKELQQQIRIPENEVASLSNDQEIEKLREELVKTKAEVETANKGLRKKKKKFKSDMDKANQEIQRLEQELADTKRQLDIDSKQHEDHLPDEDATSELESHKAKVKELEDEKQALLIQIEDLDKKVNSIDKRADDFQDIVQKKTDGNEELGSEKQVLLSEVEDTKSDVNSNLQRQNGMHDVIQQEASPNEVLPDETRGRGTGNESRASSKDQEMEQLKEELQETKAQLDTANKGLRKKRKKLKSGMENAGQEMERLKEELAYTKRQLDIATKELYDKNQDMMRQIEGIRNGESGHSGQPGEKPELSEAQQPEKKQDDKSQPDNKITSTDHSWEAGISPHQARIKRDNEEGSGAHDKASRPGQEVDTYKAMIKDLQDENKSLVQKMENIVAIEEQPLQQQMQQQLQQQPKQQLQQQPQQQLKQQPPQGREDGDDVTDRHKNRSLEFDSYRDKVKELQEENERLKREMEMMAEFNKNEMGKLQDELDRARLLVKPAQKPDKGDGGEEDVFLDKQQTLKEENEELSRKIEEIVSINGQQVEWLKSELARTLQELDSAKKKSPPVASDQRSDEFNKVVKELDVYRAKVEELLGEKRVLSEQLETTTALSSMQIESLEEELAEVQQQLADARKGAAPSDVMEPGQDRIKELEAENKTLLVEIEKMVTVESQQVVWLKQELARTQRQLADGKPSGEDDDDGENIKDKPEFASLKAQVEELKEDKERLLHQIEQMMTSHNQKVDWFERELAHTHQQLTQACKERDELKRQLQKLAEEREEMLNDIKNIPGGHGQKISNKYTTIDIVTITETQFWTERPKQTSSPLIRGAPSRKTIRRKNPSLAKTSRWRHSMPQLRGKKRLDTSPEGRPFSAEGTSPPESMVTPPHSPTQLAPPSSDQQKQQWKLYRGQPLGRSDPCITQWYPPAQNERQKMDHSFQTPVSRSDVTPSVSWADISPKRAGKSPKELLNKIMELELYNRRLTDDLQQTINASKFNNSRVDHLEQEIQELAAENRMLRRILYSHRKTRDDTPYAYYTTV